jgi:hypothetical protein
MNSLKDEALNSKPERGIDLTNTGPMSDLVKHNTTKTKAARLQPVLQMVSGRCDLT